MEANEVTEKDYILEEVRDACKAMGANGNDAMRLVMSTVYKHTNLYDLSLRQARRLKAVARAIHDAVKDEREFSAAFAEVREENVSPEILAAAPPARNPASPPILVPPGRVTMSQLRKFNPGVSDADLHKAAWVEREPDIESVDEDASPFINPPAAHGQQVGGSHYQQFKIQPYEIAERNGLTFLEGSAVKRLHRHSRGGKGLQDLEKAVHEIRLLAKQTYGKEI